MSPTIEQPSLNIDISIFAQICLIWLEMPLRNCVKIGTLFDHCLHIESSLEIHFNKPKNITDDSVLKIILI